MDRESPILSIVIPHHNGKEVLRDCLSSIYKSTRLDLEVVVVDNASNDSSGDMVRSEFPMVKVVSLNENLGFAGGCNEGIRVSTAPYILILNNDTIHKEGWIEALLNKIKSQPEIGAVQPKILSYQNREYFDYSGACGGEMDIFCFPFARGRIFDYIEKDVGQYDSYPEYIFLASGTAFLMKRDVFMKSGLFDELLFAHMEEIDLQWRMRLMGYKIAVEPEAVVWHRSGYTLDFDSPLKKYLNHRNSLILFLSNYSLLLTLYLLPMKVGLDIMALFYCLLMRDLGRLKGLLKAYIWVTSHPGNILKRRELINSKRRLKDGEVLKSIYIGSVAISYYLLRRKRYSDLRL